MDKKLYNIEHELDGVDIEVKNINIYYMNDREIPRVTLTARLAVEGATAGWSTNKPLKLHFTPDSHVIGRSEKIKFYGLEPTERRLFRRHFDVMSNVVDAIEEHLNEVLIG